MPDDSEKNEGKSAKVHGKTEFEKETWNILHFEYDFGQYLLEKLTKYGEGKPYYKAAVDAFTVQGQYLNKQLTMPFLGQQVEEYGEENKYDFVNDLANHIIPFN